MEPSAGVDGADVVAEALVAGEAAGASVEAWGAVAAGGVAAPAADGGTARRWSAG